MEITAVKSAKKLQRILRNAQAYLGGGRFPRTNTLHIFKSEVDDQPFLLSDYAGPMEFPPPPAKRIHAQVLAGRREGTDRGWLMKHNKSVKGTKQQRAPGQGIFLSINEEEVIAESALQDSRHPARQFPKFLPLRLPQEWRKKVV